MVGMGLCVFLILLVRLFDHLQLVETGFAVEDQTAGAPSVDQRIYSCVQHVWIVGNSHQLAQPLEVWHRRGCCAPHDTFLDDPCSAQSDALDSRFLNS